ALNAGVVGPDQDSVAAACHPKHFQTERRHDRALRLHHDWHAPYDAIALGANSEQAASAGSLLENRDVAKQSREIQKKLTRVATHCCKSDGRPGTFGLRNYERKSRFAEDNSRLAQCIGEDSVVARQGAQFRARVVIKIAKRIGGQVGRHPVRLSEHNVERNHEGSHLCEPGNEVGDARAVPRPLSDSLETFFVDIDNDDRPFGRLAWRKHLKEVENADAQLLNRERIGNPQGCERDEQYERKAAREPKTSSSTRKPCHRKSPAGGRNDTPVIFPGTPA